MRRLSCRKGTLGARQQQIKQTRELHILSGEARNVRNHKCGRVFKSAGTDLSSGLVIVVLLGDRFVSCTCKVVLNRIAGPKV